MDINIILYVGYAALIAAAAFFSGYHFYYRLYEGTLGYGAYTIVMVVALFLEVKYL